MTTDNYKIHKVGMRIPITWEAIAEHPRTGSYEPTGNKYTQWLAWWFGKQLYRYWRAVERRLTKFRHFEGVGGYDWEDAEYRDFEQRKEWVDEDRT